MIPKILHLCWLSGDPYPKKIQFCIDTWKKFCPDYEIMLWDTKRFDVDSMPWIFWNVCWPFTPDIQMRYVLI
jgi:hypothetical protein